MLKNRLLALIFFSIGLLTSSLHGELYPNAAAVGGGRAGATGATGPAGAPGPSSGLAAYAYFFARVDEQIYGDAVPTYGLAEFQQNPENVNVGGFTIETGADTNNPSFITAIVVPSTGYYSISVFLSNSSDSSPFYIVKNIGAVTPMLGFTGTVTSFTALNGGNTSLAGLPGLSLSIIQLNAGDKLSVINPSQATIMLDGSSGGGVIGTSVGIRIEYLGS